MSLAKAIIIAAFILALSHVLHGYLVDFDAIIKCTDPDATCIMNIERD